MSFYSDQAAQFLQLAKNIQARLANAGSDLDDATYQSLENQRDSLLNQVNKMVLPDIQVSLAALNLDESRLQQCTASLNHAAKIVKKWEQVLSIGTAGLSLITACVSGDPSKIVNALAGAEKTVAAALKSNPAAAVPAQPSA